MPAATGVEIHANLNALKTELVHGPSSTRILTVPPRDNGGDGSSFSPTDLVAAALTSCALTTMELLAKREGLSWADGASATIVKHMGGTPRQIVKLELAMVMPSGINPAHRERLEAIARTCPVAKSLAPSVEMPMTFRWS